VKAPLQERKTEQANLLKNLILGRGDDGPLSAISEIFGNILERRCGRNEKIVPVEDFVSYLVQAGFGISADEVKEKVLPDMEDRSMYYKATADCCWSIRTVKVSNAQGNVAYRVSRYIG